MCKQIIFVVCVLLTCSIHGCFARWSDGFQVRLQQDGSYQVVVDGQQWLKSAPTFFTANKKQYSTSDGSLILIRVDTEKGTDSFGAWNMSSLLYKPSGLTLNIKAMVKVYQNLPLVLFGQHFESAIDGSSVNDRFAVSSGFPSFYVGDSSSRDDLGYLAYGGIMAGDTYMSVGKWTKSAVVDSGLDCGPLVLFDRADNAVIIAPFTNFMAGSVQYTDRYGARIASWGLLGSADSIPKDFSYWTAITYSSHGINKLMDHWGNTMRKYYKKTRAFTESDFINNYLGYWTDNGAYYYYLTEGSMNYEDTILAVKQYSDQQHIPYRYVQYDSWWYPKGPAFGVTEWTSMSDIFPNGLQYLWNKTGWPVIAHNRWWSNEVRYAKQNGGKYNFLLENKTKKALPLDEAFWDDLLKESKKWGLVTYEQDWLNVQFDQMYGTVASLTLGRQWLHQMAKGAAKNGMTIQYCMSPARHALTSLEIPVVTQMRVSNDYHPGQSNWKIGISSMFAHALGVGPFKDNFWSTEVQPGNSYNATEPHSALHALVSTLSTGPVGPSDKIGHSNVELIMRSCNKDGLLLKPSRPAMSINKQIKKAAYSGFTGEVYSTYSYISGLQFGIILGAAFSAGENMTVTPKEAGFHTKHKSFRQFTWNNPANVKEFSETYPVHLQACSSSQFCLVYTTPVINLGNTKVILFGELSKWVPMSSKRITGISVASDVIEISMTGAVMEKVTMVIRLGGQLYNTSCVLGKTGTAILSVTSSSFNCFAI